MRIDGLKSRLAVALLIAVQAGFTGVAAQEAAEAGPTIAERLERIENALTNQGLLEMVQQIQTLELEINRLRGEMEVQNHTLEQLKKRQRDLYTDIDRRMQRLENPVTTGVGAASGGAEPPLQTLSPFDGAEVVGEQQTVTPLTLELVDQEPSAAADAAPLGAPAEQDQDVAQQSAQLPGPASEPAQEMVDGGAHENMTAETSGPETGEPGTAEEIAAEAGAKAGPEQIEAAYQQAFSLLKQSLYGRAITAFGEFLARFPDSEQAESARFWLAEAYYVNGYFEQALAEYDALTQQHPESRKLSQAQLKAAFCEHELGRAESATARLQEIVQLYPGTTAASLAQDRLSAIATEAAAAEGSSGAEPN